MSHPETPEDLRARLGLYRRHLRAIAIAHENDVSDPAGELKDARAYAKLALDNERNALEIDRRLRAELDSVTGRVKR